VNQAVVGRLNLSGKLYISGKKLFYILSKCVFSYIEIVKMRFTTFSIVQAVLGVATASLYPGQSNLNHTCALREFFH
jgi:hypothetical protein